MQHGENLVQLKKRENGTKSLHRNLKVVLHYLWHTMPCRTSESLTVGWYLWLKCVGLPGPQVETCWDRLAPFRQLYSITYYLWMKHKLGIVEPSSANTVITHQPELRVNVGLVHHLLLKSWKKLGSSYLEGKRQIWKNLNIQCHMPITSNNFSVI